MLKLLRVSLTLTGFILAAGCQTAISLDAYPAGNLRPATLTTSSFPLRAMLPTAGQYSRLRVYIEGDGHAWATSMQPSTDPTPLTSVMLQLAATDTTPAAYLARPCQYANPPGCNVAVWTSERFSQPQINAMNAALTMLKQRFGVHDFELVGHSGGATIALVLAALRSDVAQVQTLAGNLDPDFWTQRQHLSPLRAPVLPLQYRGRLQQVPQRHFIGSEDAVVPPAVAESYRGALQGECVETVTLKATHQQGYSEAWSRLANTPVRCGQAVRWINAQPVP